VKSPEDKKDGTETKTAESEIPKDDPIIEKKKNKFEGSRPEET
jgi:hypothetical protein